MIIVLTGAPGAGKGTQAEMLAAKCGYKTFSTGHALRKHVKEGTDIGKKAEAIMARGDLVSDAVLLEILKAELQGKESDVVLLDGYPRNIPQAEALDTIDKQIVKGAVQLEVPREELISRLSGRRVCAQCGATYHAENSPPENEGVCDKCGGEVVQRTDDSAESVAHRLDVYEENTKPVLDYYREKNLFHSVSGTGSPEEIFERLKEVIGSLT